VVEKAQPCFYRGTSAWLSRSPAASSLFPPPAGPRLQLKVKQELLRSDKWQTHHYQIGSSGIAAFHALVVSVAEATYKNLALPPWALPASTTIHRPYQAINWGIDFHHLTNILTFAGN